MLLLEEAPPAPIDWLWVLAAMVVGVLVLKVSRRVIEGRRDTALALGFGHQLTMLGLTLLVVTGVIISIPDKDIRSDTLGFFGIVLTAAVALSSTSLLGNAMAGIMLRAVKNYHIGDFIEVEKHFGRVTELGLMHTELQTEYRDLTTLPNLFLATHPVKVVRPSGTVLSASVSIGYDVPRGQVQEALLLAASDAGLKDGFVLVMDLGDYSITYRVAGLLTNVTHLVSSRSKLRKSMLDRLHGAGIEIVSPTFMNTRAQGAGSAAIPGTSIPRPESDAPERVIFDKAEVATSLVKMREMLTRMDEELAEAKKEADDEDRVTHLEQRKQRLEEAIEAAEEKKGS